MADLDDNLPYEVFNLKGVKMAKTIDSLTTGIYIIRQGGNSHKMVVK